MNPPTEQDELRHFVYDSIIDRGGVPSTAQIAQHFGTSRPRAVQLIRDAKLGKTALPHPQSGEIWMAGPFAAWPTPHRVRADDRVWFANCAWDALGVAAVLDRPVEIETTCADCGMRLAFPLSPGDTSIGDMSVHFLVPARHWYDDIGFT